MAIAGRALVIRGAAGSGKSGLALDLMALGAELVADDSTILTREGERLIASAPGTIRGRIEARGIGILNAPAAEPVPVALVAELLNMEFVEALRSKGLSEIKVIKHVTKNAAPQVLAVMGLQLGYLLGGSILIETVFAWPGTGLLLNNAIFSRDIPVLQGTILALALIFVALNLTVDIVQATLDPRIKR